jgi:hypothetical protein
MCLVIPMDKNRFIVDWDTIRKTELYSQIVEWAKSQLALFQERCSIGDIESEWRKNQGRSDAYKQIIDKLTHPEKIFDKERDNRTTASQKER